MFKLLRRNIKGYTLRFLLVFALIIALNYVRSLVPVFIGELFRVIEGEQSSQLPALLRPLMKGDVNRQLLLAMILLLSVYLSREALNIAYDMMVAICGEGVGIKAQRRFFAHISHLPYLYLSGIETGDLIQRATNDITKFKSFLTQTLPRVVGNLAIIFFFCLQIFLISPYVLGFVAIFIPIIMVVTFIVFIFMQRRFKEIEEADGKISTIVQENLTGIRVVKAFANEDFENQKFDSGMKEMIKVWNSINVRMSLFWGLSDTLIIIPTIITFVVAVNQAAVGNLTTSQALTLFILIQTTLWPVRNLARNLSDLGRTSIACKRINEILAVDDEFVDDGEVEIPLVGRIEFRDVSFNYPNSTIATLDHLDLVIEAGTRVAIVGRTGSGKSTLVHLINRMFDPTSGEILIDGVPTLRLAKRPLRSKIGMVMQEPFLYSRTIEENIKITCPQADSSSMREVAQIASIEKDILDFKEGYGTLVGERGVTLSGGQKQRIAIARALMGEKPLLIFDDSLSAVDTQTDQRIQEALWRNTSRTTIIITHRVTTAMNADKIVVLDGGRIAQVGTHQELIKVPGLYQTINNIQSGDNGGEADA